jgi:Zn-dependent protease with chaperone function
MEKKAKSSLLGRIFRLEILIKLVKNKWFYICLLIIVLASIGYRKYRQFVYIPEEGKDFRLESFSLGHRGEKPFYQSDDDYELTLELEEMKNKPALKYVAGKYYDLYRERFSQGKLASQNIEVNGKQFPEIYWMVKDACEIIGIDRIPGVYMGRSVSEELIVTNYRNPNVIIGSEFLWAFKPEELRFLLAREIVHIKCNHVFFLDMIKGVKSVINAALPDFISEFIVGSMGIKFMNWYKEAEITADRGALVVTGNIDVAIHALIKLNIGANFEDLYGEPDPREYIKQIDKLDESAVSTTSAAMFELKNPNPFLTMRVRNLLRWYNANRVIFK